MSEGPQLRDAYDLSGFPSLTEGDHFARLAHRDRIGRELHSADGRRFATDPTSLTSTSGGLPGAAPFPTWGEMGVDGPGVGVTAIAGVAYAESIDVGPNGIWVGGGITAPVPEPYCAFVPTVHESVAFDRPLAGDPEPGPVTGALILSTADPSLDAPVWTHDWPASQLPVVSVPKPPLHPLYSMRDVKEVTAYLRKKPGVIQELWNIADAVRRYFPGRPIALEVLYDAEEPLTTLCVYIQAGRDAARANAQLERFDQEWWLDQSVDVDEDISVDVEYR